MFNLDPAWIALIGTLCGGLGLKVLEHWLGKSKVKIDEASKLRDELRIQLNEQREEIKDYETRLNALQREYYDLRDKYSELNVKYLSALEKLKLEAEQEAKKSDTSIESGE
jgi:chromosome segregation ATPase